MGTSDRHAHQPSKTQGQRKHLLESGQRLDHLSLVELEGQGGCVDAGIGDLEAPREHPVVVADLDGGQVHVAW